MAEFTFMEKKSEKNKYFAFFKEIPLIYWMTFIYKYVMISN